MSRGLAGAAAALALLLAGCHDDGSAVPPASDADRRAVRAAVTDLLTALSDGSPQRFCAALTGASQRDLAARRDAGSCAAYVEANRKELLATDVRRDEIPVAVRELRIAVNGDRALARTGDNDFPLRREAGGFRLDLLAVEQ